MSSIVASQISIFYFIYTHKSDEHLSFIGAYLIIPACFAHFYLTRKVGLVTMMINILYLIFLPIINDKRFNYYEFSIPIIFFLIIVYGMIFLSTNSPSLLINDLNIKTNYSLNDNLYENSLKLKAIFNEANDVIIYLNDQGTIELVNPSINYQFGYSHKDVIGKNVKILMPPPYYDEHDDYIMNYLTTGVRKIIGQGREVLAKSKDDKIFPIHLSISELDLGHEKKFIGIIRDISDIKNSQKLINQYLSQLESQLDEKSKLYQNLFQNSRDAIFMIDENGYLLECNQAMMDILYPEIVNTSEIDITKINIDGLFKSEIIVDRLKEKLLIQGFVKDFEFEMHIDELRVLSCVMSANIIMSQTSEFGGYLAILRDLTQVKILEAYANQEQKFEIVARISSGFAHDFNNVLTIITGYSEFLSSLTVDPNLIDGLNEINKTSIRASQLIKQLLSFSKREISSQKQNVNLTQLINGFQEIISKTLPSNIVVQYELDPMRRLIYVDPVQIEQILFNLIFNSRDAMPEGGTLTITSKIIESEIQDEIKSAVVLTVEDTGMGIDDNIKSDIFKPFFTTKSEEKGTGLGLAMVNELVYENGGNINFESKIDIGTKFTIGFPALRAEIKISESVLEISKPFPENIGILIVDDNKDIVKILEKHYESRGATTYGFSNSLNALAFIKEQNQSVDVALLDIVMPYIGGVELAKRIEEYNSDIKIILISGYFNEEKLTQIIKKEGFYQFDKPINFSKLDQFITDVLDKDVSSK